MREKVISVILSLCLIINIAPVTAFAITDDVKVDEEQYIDIGAYSVANNVTINKILEQNMLTARQGHGFAAELGNNLIDNLKGQNATIVGNDFSINGADRKIIGRDGSVRLIQDKYYSTAQSSIDACFEKGKFRYSDDGIPMQIEVPRDQYDDAVSIMKKRIESGKLRDFGITDPAEATNLVKKGSLTYKQAVNLAQFGTVESLTYDAINGTVSAGCAFGISSLITYSVSRMNGDSAEEALKVAAAEGLRTGGVVFGASIVAGQFAKQNAPKIFLPTSKAIVDTFGDDFARALLNSVGQETTGLRKDKLKADAATVLRNQAITAGITIILLSASDVVDIVRGRISAEQLIKNLAVTTAGVVGGYAGTIIGGSAGSAIAPGIGTTAGSVIGGIAVGGIAGYGAEKVLGIIIKDDADKMILIIEDEFYELGQEYLLNEEEAESIIINLKKELTGENLKNMFASESREQFAKDIIEPLIISEVSMREQIKAPTEQELRQELKNSMKDLVFIH